MLWLVMTCLNTIAFIFEIFFHHSVTLVVVAAILVTYKCCVMSLSCANTASWLIVTAVEITRGAAVRD